MSAPKTIYVPTRNEDGLFVNKQYRLVDPSEPDPLEAVRAEIENEQKSEQLYEGGGNGRYWGLTHALEIIDKAKGVK